MSNNRIKVIGEGGVHLHKVNSSSSTEKDGIHKHLFFINDRLLMTDLSGAHSHSVNVKESKINDEEKPLHKHTVKINTEKGVVDFFTTPGAEHTHELQSGTTTLSGLHTHELVLGGESYISLLPGDLIQAVEQAVKSVPALKSFKVRENNDTPLEMDFETIARLNKSDFKLIMKEAAFVATIKSLSNLRQGFQIQSLVLSREQFTDMGAATKFLTDHALDYKSSEEITAQGKFVFVINSKDRFVESSLTRVRVTEGVVAIVGLYDSDEVGAQLADAKVSVAAPEDSNPQTVQATESEQTVVSGTIDEMTDNMNNTGTQDMSMKSLRERFTKTKENFAVVTNIKKKATTKAKEFVNWKTNKAVTGSALESLQDLAEKNNINKKFVTVEYPMKRYIEFLVTKYETISAVYENTAGTRDTEEKEYASLHVKGEGIEAFILKRDRWSKDLVIFFDDENNLDELFKTEINDYAFGAYQYRQTMMGPALYPVEMAKNAFCILDEELMANLKRDTEQFFSAETQEFFENNPDGHEMDYKRGIFLHGPPGNGKTTFIKNFLITQKDCYGILCEANDFDSGMGKFLAQRLGKNAKKALVFEDVDALAHRYEMRSSFLNFLDGVGGLHKVLILATSNYPHMLDDALLKRPSRFDQKYKIDLPNLVMRTKFMKHWFKKLTDNEAMDFAKKTVGFSGAFFKELYILKNLQKCTIDEAIKRLILQMQDIRKRAPTAAEINEEDVQKSWLEECITKVEETVQQKLAKVKATFSDDKEETTKRLGFMEIIKKDESKRLVTGPVLVPENVDLQDDIISADEIEKAAHNYVLKLSFQDDPKFMAKLGLSGKSKRGFMHVEFNRKIALVESYCAPCEMTINDRKITAGTWVMTVKVFDDEAWNLVKAGRITGFSIGGRSRAVPEKKGK